jgi:hypothetical protein
MGFKLHQEKLANRQDYQPLWSENNPSLEKGTGNGFARAESPNKENRRRQLRQRLRRVIRMMRPS